MIRAGMPTRVYYTSLGGFDTHAQQGGRRTPRATPHPTQRVLSVLQRTQGPRRRPRPHPLLLRVRQARLAERLQRDRPRRRRPGLPRRPDGPPGRPEHPPSMNDLEDGDLLRHRLPSIYTGVLQDWLRADARAAGGSFRRRNSSGGPETPVPPAALNKGGPNPGWPLRSAPRMQRRTVLLVGNFDGVHAGHVALLEGPARSPPRTQTRPASSRWRSAAPDARPRAGRAQLTTFAQRERSSGARARRGDPPRPLLGHPLTPRKSSSTTSCKHCRSPSSRRLTSTSARARGDIDTSTPSQLGASPSRSCPRRRASATRAGPGEQHAQRWLVAHGASPTRAHPHTPYEISGRGRALAPGASANSASPPPTSPPSASPGRASTPGATLADGSTHPAAISVGTNPTFGEHALSVEAHLSAGRGFATTTREYGWPIELTFDAWLRDQVRFESIETLKDQMCATSLAPSIASDAAANHHAHSGAGA